MDQKEVRHPQVRHRLQGLLPKANEGLAPLVWNGPDERLLQAVQENLKQEGTREKTKGKDQ